MAQLNARSDWKGWGQTGGYIGLLTLTGGLAIYGVGRWPWWIVVMIVFLHGSFHNVMSSAVHELIHRTVFKTKWLNDFFARFFSFFSWFSNASFHPSHMEHHKHTLHQPDDLEVVLPSTMLKRHLLQYGFLSCMEFVNIIKHTLRHARGRFEGEWECKLFPADEPEKQRGPILWARTQLAGHALLIAVSVALGLWVSPRWFLLPVLTSCTNCYGRWLFMLLATPQHIGLQDETSDYRLCCRTYTAHPFLQFLYWNMNYHVEHHMYAAVPCYNLGKLHRAIEHDLPPCPHGVIATWKQISEILEKQKTDPKYQYVAPLPYPELNT